MPLWSLLLSCNVATAVAAGICYRVVAYKQNDISASGYINHADYGKVVLFRSFYFLLIVHILWFVVLMSEYSGFASLFDRIVSITCYK